MTAVAAPEEAAKGIAEIVAVAADTAEAAGTGKAVEAVDTAAAAAATHTAKADKEAAEIERANAAPAAAGVVAAFAHVRSVSADDSTAEYYATAAWFSSLDNPVRGVDPCSGSSCSVCSAHVSVSHRSLNHGLSLTRLSPCSSPGNQV